MTETVDDMANQIDTAAVAAQLLAQASEQGVELVGPERLLNALTKQVLESALQAEMDEHLGYENTRSKSITAELPQWGPPENGADRDRAGADRGDPRYRCQL